ncbi:hypothetical protein [Aliiroseovarius sp. PrR006]|uniref:hypothetical protein n=1 Tax=Aliiroseovarius sp. PrR006 TaxID=2706883 RepID=UPI0013D889A5|nr:hypothetical protein [Aliiroseovarius sp. PrR006]NDW51882.1 hypothetical protein [Aliiroseovarius sp. PrR006]
MNANQLINMVIRMVTRRLINKGVNTGIDIAARKGRQVEDMTPEQQKEAQKARDLAKRGRKTMRIGKRLF